MSAPAKSSIGGARPVVDAARGDAARGRPTGAGRAALQPAHDARADEARRSTRGAAVSVTAGHLPRGRRGRARFALVARAALLAVVTSAGAAQAEGAWLTARGRLQPETRVEAWGGPRTVGLGLVRPDDAEARGGWGVETSFAFLDRTLELRGTRVWQLSKTRFATGSATVGASGFMVTAGGLDLGLGPHAGLTLSLGGRTFSVDLGLQTGFEFFVNQDAPRLPQRALIGFNFLFGRVTVSLMARAGADIIPGHFFVGRGEFVVSLGWLR